MKWKSWKWDQIVLKMTRSCLKFEFKVLSLILKPFCPFWAPSDGCTQGRMAISRAQLTAPPQRAHNTHFHPPSTSCWLLPKVERKEQGPEVTRASGWNRVLHLSVPSQLSPSCFGDTHAWNKHRRAHTHTPAHSCFMPTSKSGQFLTVTFCLPAKHRQTQTLKNGSTLLRSREVSCFAQSSVKTLTMRKNERSNDRFQCNKLHVEFVGSGGTQLSPEVINYILHSLLSLGF